MGINVQIISAGDGKSFPRAGDHVSCEYVGMLEDGVVFDSSHGPGKPSFTFEVGVKAVIMALDEGIKSFSVGQKAILTATPDCAYGPTGFPPLIPPDSTLKFEVKLLGIS